MKVSLFAVCFWSLFFTTFTAIAESRIPAPSVEQGEESRFLVDATALKGVLSFSPIIHDKRSGSYVFNGRIDRDLTVEEADDLGILYVLLYDGDGVYMAKTLAMFNIDEVNQGDLEPKFLKGALFRGIFTIPSEGIVLGEEIERIAIYAGGPVDIGPISAGVVVEEAR